MVMSVADGMFTARSLDSTDEFRIVHWGDPNLEDFIAHKDPERRDRYRARAMAITGGRFGLAHLDPWQPNHWAVHATWPLGPPTIPAPGEARVLAGRRRW